MEWKGWNSGLSDHSRLQQSRLSPILCRVSGQGAPSTTRPFPVQSSSGAAQFNSDLSLPGAVAHPTHAAPAHPYPILQLCPSLDAPRLPHCCLSIRPSFLPATSSSSSLLSLQKGLINAWRGLWNWQQLDWGPRSAMASQGRGSSSQTCWMEPFQPHYPEGWSQEGEEEEEAGARRESEL